MAKTSLARAIRGPCSCAALLTLSLVACGGITEKPGRSPVEAPTSGSLHHAAELQVRNGRWLQALELCEQALQRDRKDVDAHTCRLFSLAALGRYADATRALEEFRTEAPARALDTAGALLYRYGDVRGARTVFEQCANDLQPRNPYCWVQLVNVHFARGREDEALAAASQALTRAQPGAVLDTLWDRLCAYVVLRHDRTRLESSLGRPFPRRGGGSERCDHLPVLRTTDVRTDLPLSMEKSWALVEVSINGYRARLVVDTAADHVAVTRAFASRVGLKSTRSSTVYGEGGTGTVTEDQAVVSSLRVGPAVFEDLPVNISDVSPVPGDGVLGVALLRDFLVDLDFPARRLRLAPAGLDPSRAFGSLPRGTTSIQFLLARRVPLIPGIVNGSLAGWFLLDTGGEGNVFNARHLPRFSREAGVRLAPPPPGGGTMKTFGVGGETAGGYLTPLEANIGPFVTEYEHVPAVTFRFEPGVWLLGGWGMEILRNYRLILDYPRRRLYIAWPGTGADAPAGVVHMEHLEPELVSQLFAE